MAAADRVLADLRVRRLLAQHAGRRLAARKRKPPAQLWPRAPRARYFSRLKGLVDDMRAAARATLIPGLPRLLGHVELERPAFRRDGAGDFENELDRLLHSFTDIVGGVNLDTVARTAAQQTDAFNREQVGKQFRAVLGVDLLQYEPSVAQQIDLFTLDNVRLIKGMTADLEHQVKGLVVAAARAGTATSDLADSIMERFDVTMSRAALIARDQIGKFNGELTQIRQTGAGVDEYIWLTAHDELVRAGHRLLDGTRQRWDDPPVENPRTGDTGHPGEPINCRCTASPVFDGLLAKLAG